MDEVENGLRGFGEILYGVSVVGVVVSETYGIYGARTHSAWRYGCVYMLVQLYRWNNYIYVNVIIYVYTYGHIGGCMLS